tara:strand:- start:640 stop:1215 length:576 start_codon:yes stop_codon:yes gene_type:complete
MIRIGILGDIGSGKTYVANNFGFPVFDADREVGKIYKKDKKIFKRLRKELPKYFIKFPAQKEEVSKAILDSEKNLKKIVKIVHLEIRRKMNSFLKKNRDKKYVILDIPLLLENKINNKNDILIFVHSKKTEIDKKLKKRKNFNKELVKKFRRLQLPLDYKKKKSQFIIENNFSHKSVSVRIKNILRKIENE